MLRARASSSRALRDWGVFMSEGDDMLFPAAANRPAANGRARRLEQFDASMHGCLLATGSDEDDPFAVELHAPRNSAPRDGRGHYDRSGGKGVRIAWLPHVQNHMEAVTQGDLSALVRPCAKDCPQGGKCMENVGLIRVLKICAAESFGEAALEQEWKKITLP